MTPTESEKFLKEARKRFNEAESAESDNRTLSLRDMKFENGGGEQWTETERIERKGRPCMEDNRIAGAVKLITGEARMNRPRIKVHPSDSEADPVTAEIYNGLIRNIENISDAEAAYDTGHDSSVRGAIGYWRIITDYASDDTIDEQEIFIERIPNAHSVYFDQSALKATWEDAGYCFVIEDLRKEKFKELYPEAATTGWEGKAEGEAESGWFSEETIRRAEYWWKEPYTKNLFKLESGETIEVKKPKIETIISPQTGEPLKTVRDGDGAPMVFTKTRRVQCDRVMQALISGVEILDGPNEWPGKYIPIVPCLGEEIWIDGKRILRSAIRHAIDPQRVLNWNVSNDIEFKALSPKQPWLVTQDQIKGHEEQWDAAYFKPMPYLTWNFVPGQGKPERLTGSFSDNGAVQGIAMAIDAVKSATGIFDASLGARSNETSGIAIERRARQGNLATYVFTDNQTRAVRYTGKILVDLIPKIYDNDRVVRLLGDDLRKSFMRHQQMVQSQKIPMEAAAQIDERGFRASIRINFKDPITGETYNDLSKGKYDVNVDAGPGFMTRRQEAANGMIQLSQAAPQFMPIFIPRIAKNLDWPDSDELADELKGAGQPQGPSIDDQIKLAKGKLDIQGKQIDLQAKQVQAQKEMNDNDERTINIVRNEMVSIFKQIGLI